MGLLLNCIKEKDRSVVPIWLMRQAGRYLPEFREIRKKNPNFINLCLNEKLSEEITLQPIKRFGFDAAIIFSDILMVPFGMGQSVEFKKDLGPILGEVDIEKLMDLSDNQFSAKLNPIYKLLNNLSNHDDLKNKDLIGFVGAPWTILVYMINRKSPKRGLPDNFFNNPNIDKLIKLIVSFLKIHIKNQIDSGANLIQIFDSWASLLTSDIDKYIYEPMIEIVNFVQSQGIPVICFPKGISNYKDYCDKIKPNLISIDFDVNPAQIVKNIDIPVQGGLDPKILLTDKENLKKKTLEYLNIFKDHPYVFNLGHGILPNTEISMVEELIKLVRNFK